MVLLMLYFSLNFIPLILVHYLLWASMYIHLQRGIVNCLGLGLLNYLQIELAIQSYN